MLAIQLKYRTAVASTTVSEVDRPSVLGSRSATWHRRQEGYLQADVLQLAHATEAYRSARRADAFLRLTWRDHLYEPAPFLRAGEVSRGSLTWLGVTVEGHVACRGDKPVS